MLGTECGQDGPEVQGGHSRGLWDKQEFVELVLLDKGNVLR